MGAPPHVEVWRGAVWRQFGAAIDMLENAMLACPEALWSDRSRRPEFWAMAFHTLFWLDLYLGGPVEGFRPPAPFGLEELDPRGILPERVYTKGELHSYLVHCREKCSTAIGSLNDEAAGKTQSFRWGTVTIAELLLYNLRHVQHHAAQLNLLLRQTVDSAPDWVGQTQVPCPIGKETERVG
jgi:hypothetical protein